MSRGSSSYRAAYEKRRRRHTVIRLFLRVLLVFLVLAGSAAFIFFGKHRQNGKLLAAYVREQTVQDVHLPDGMKPKAFAEDLAVITNDRYSDPNVYSDEALLIQADSGKVLFSDSALTEMANASTTKLVTFLCALKYGNMDDMVTVTDDAISPLVGTNSSSAHLAVGDRIRFSDLMYAMMLPSGNDAANVVALHMAGNIPDFCSMMDQVCFELGATHSHFKSPHGLDAVGHYSTAYDLYLITRELMKYPAFFDITGTASYTAKYTNEAGETVSQTWLNTNEYFHGMPLPAGIRVVGGKTGSEENAGYCLVCVTMDQQDRRYVSVVLGAPNNNARYGITTNLLSKITN